MATGVTTLAGHVGRGVLVNPPEEALVACGVDNGHSCRHGTASRVSGECIGAMGMCLARCAAMVPVDLSREPGIVWRVGRQKCLRDHWRVIIMASRASKMPEGSLLRQCATSDPLTMVFFIVTVVRPLLLLLPNGSVDHGMHAIRKCIAIVL